MDNDEIDYTWDLPTTDTSDTTEESSGLLELYTYDPDEY